MGQDNRSEVRKVLLITLLLNVFVMALKAKDVESAHKITEDVEDRLEERFSPVRVLIHVEPPDYKSDHVSFEQETL